LGGFKGGFLMDGELKIEEEESPLVCGMMGRMTLPKVQLKTIFVG
jgi:hypothetical protein